MGIKASRVVEIALAEAGYLEKKSTSKLDDKTANAGSNNYTKYARDLVKWIGSPYANGVAWCDMFVDWVIIKACMEVTNTTKKALAMAKELLGGWSAYTPTSANYYKEKGRYGTTPKVGAQIFFKNSARIYHTGVVVKIANGYVYTAEGNTSSAAGVVANGGCVRKKSYAVGYSRIAGYGYPEYERTAETENKEPAKVNTFKDLVKDLQTAINKEYKAGLAVDGIPGSKTLAATPTLNRKTRAKKPRTVKALQVLLTYYGYKCAIDGDFYTATEKKVKSFQSEKVGQKNPDGEFTAKQASWKKILKLS